MTTQELTQEVNKINPAIAHIEEKVDGCAGRLEAVEKEQKEQGKLLLVVERLANGVENVRKDLGGLDCKIDKVAKRVESIEEKPAKRWEAMVAQIITLVIAAGFGYFLSKLIP